MIEEKYRQNYLEDLRKYAKLRRSYQQYQGNLEKMEMENIIDSMQNSRGGVESIIDLAADMLEIREEL